jgi:predicted phosphodiesterase
MLNIIAIADDDSLVGHIEPSAEVDILLSLGDLYDVTLEKAIDLYAPEQVFAVRGNHCVDTVFPVPTVDLHLRIGIHERDADNHQGFEAFLDYIDRVQPAYFLHGHQHCNFTAYRGKTCIMGIYGEKKFQIPKLECTG